MCTCDYTSHKLNIYNPSSHHGGMVHNVPIVIGHPVHKLQILYNKVGSLTRKQLTYNTYILTVAVSDFWKKKCRITSDNAISRMSVSTQQVYNKTLRLQLCCWANSSPAIILKLQCCCDRTFFAHIYMQKQLFV